MINDLIIFSGEAFGNKINCLNFEAQTSAAAMVDFGILERYQLGLFNLLTRRWNARSVKKMITVEFFYDRKIVLNQTNRDLKLLDLDDQLNKKLTSFI